MDAHWGQISAYIYVSSLLSDSLVSVKIRAYSSSLLIQVKTSHRALLLILIAFHWATQSFDKALAAIWVNEVSKL
jgi:hypothetical protein